MSEERRDLAALAALTAAALASRLWFRIDHDEDIDALRFALGVERFDVASLRPHAPYYPVLIAAAKGLALLGAAPRAALALVSAASGAAAVAFTALLAREVAGRRAAAFAGILALASPFLWLSSEKLLSDMAGAAVTTAALWLCARGRRLRRAADAAEAETAAREANAARARTAALVLLGVGLGVRLSYFPFALACLAVIARSEGGRLAWLARGRDLATGALAWLVPLVLIATPRDLVATTWVQGLGHFTRWGGTAITVSSPADRLHGVVWGIWANGLGGAWPDAPAARWLGAPILLALLAAAALRAAPLRRAARAARDQPELFASALAYFVWALLGQNIAFKPRHWLPLVPLLIVALAAGAAALAPARSPAFLAAGASRGRALRSAAPAALVAALAAQWLADAVALARQHQAPSPAAAIVGFLRDAGAEQRPVLTRDLDRMIQEGAPGRRPVRVRGDDELVRAVEQAGPGGALITSEALSPAARDALAGRGYALSVRFARPRSRYVDALWSDLALLEALPAGSPAGRPLPRSPRGAPSG
ncbi:MULTISPECIES: hypothetical protein [Sorangium]|uniref:Glycosyltransferase RgtA/B/C/D-like domain-containing protein n=1 Tax=Sorangium cellulosum TaxID=56 RepID=A0A4P2QTR1_SORCE|nr:MULTISPECIES: hypothetical protein [Sorangium]AUX33734.1 hypothetical protein SOCE836_058980 [Sorangium cellulosum]WCQ93045.1 hypothetical protein NQZ70_05793 [Sorangium sp. Soce836]